MGVRTRVMTGLLLCASIVAIVALSSFASPFRSYKVFAGVSPDQDSSVLHTRGYYNSLRHMPVLAPNTSMVNNRVMLTGSKARGIVTASYVARHRQGSGGPDSHRIELKSNRLIMFGGYIEGSVHGAFGEGGASAFGNTLIVDDEKAHVQAVDSPSSDAAATGAVGIEARHNALLMYSGVVQGSLAGGHGQFLAADNSVMMHGGRVAGAITGAAPTAAIASAIP